jgi:hypothetical protein
LRAEIRLIAAFGGGLLRRLAHGRISWIILGLIAGFIASKILNRTGSA